MVARMCVLMLALVLAQGALLGQSGPLIGTWKANVAKSTYSPGPPPQNATTTIEAVPGGIRLTADGMNSQGQTTHTEYTVMFDGKDYSQKGTIAGNPNPNLDTISWKKIDDYTYENISKVKGQVLITTRIVISKDGKTRTNTVTGKNAQGQTMNNTVVYDKQ